MCEQACDAEPDAIFARPAGIYSQPQSLGTGSFQPSALPLVMKKCVFTLNIIALSKVVLSKVVQGRGEGRLSFSTVVLSKVVLSTFKGCPFKGCLFKSCAAVQVVLSKVVPTHKGKEARGPVFERNLIKVCHNHIAIKKRENPHYCFGVFYHAERSFAEGAGTARQDG